MMSHESKDLKLVAVSALTISAAVLIMLSCFGLLKDPSRDPSLHTASFAKPDVFNTRLDSLQAILAPVDEYLPAGAALNYVGREDLFEYFQSVLAPRRIAPALDSPYILIFVDDGEVLERHAVQQHAQMVLKLSDSMGLLQRVGQP